MIEILSPSTARRDRTEKKDLYAANGIEEYWLVDADRQEVMVFTLQQGRYDAGRLCAGGAVTSSVLPLLAVRVDELFALY